MLRLAGGQVESLLDELLPVEVHELPRDLAALDRLLVDRRLLAPIEQVWAQTARGHGRPTIPMGSFVRLMVIKQRTGWGYETLVQEVSDSLHLRRFCLLPLTQRVPDESTVRKLVRRLDPEGQQPHRPADVGQRDQGAGQLPATHLERADELQRPEHKQRRQHQPDDPEQRVQHLGLEQGDTGQAVHRPVNRYPRCSPTATPR